MPPLPLAIVVPLYCEAPAVPALADRLRALVQHEAPPRRVELILVDDGSTDATAALLEQHCDGLDARVLRHAANLGLTAALRTGSRAARSPLIGWLDADLTYDPAILLAMAEAVEAGAEIAVASCHHPGGALVGVPSSRAALSRLASRLYRTASGCDLHTFTCMVRVHRAAALEDWQPHRDGFAGVTEALLDALQQGRRVVEVPAVLTRRRAGRSKMRLWRATGIHIGLLGQTLWRRMRNRQR